MIGILIKGKKILTMEGRTYSPGCVLTKGKIIKKIAENINECENDDGIIIDAGDCWVMPGLIDAHSHLGIYEEQKGQIGDNSNETCQPITPYLKAIDAINPMDCGFHNAIATGITAAMVGPGSSNVVGGQFVFIKTEGRCIDDMVVKEPAAMKIAFGENPKNNYGEKDRMPSTSMSVGAMLREALFDAYQYYESKKQAEKKGDPFLKNFKKESWIPVLKKEIPLKAHAHRADDIQTAIRIANLYNLDLTLDHCTEGHLITEEIKKSGFPAIVGPSLASKNKIEVRYMDFKTAGILSKAGIKVAITTDHPVTLIQCLPLCAGIAAKEGLGIEEGLRAITINAAEICRVDDRVGSLKEGKDADIAIFNGNPMDVFTSCLYTIINGKLVYKADGIDEHK